jgi:hypothetical protein
MPLGPGAYKQIAYTLIGSTYMGGFNAATFGVISPLLFSAISDQQATLSGASGYYTAYPDNFNNSNGSNWLRLWGTIGGGYTELLNFSSSGTCPSFGTLFTTDTTGSKVYSSAIIWASLVGTATDIGDQLILYSTSLNVLSPMGIAGQNMLVEWDFGFGSGACGWNYQMTSSLMALLTTPYAAYAWANDARLNLIPGWWNLVVPVSARYFGRDGTVIATIASYTVSGYIATLVFLGRATTANFLNPTYLDIQYNVSGNAAGWATTQETMGRFYRNNELALQGPKSLFGSWVSLLNGEEFQATFMVYP